MKRYPFNWKSQVLFIKVWFHIFPCKLVLVIASTWLIINDSMINYRTIDEAIKRANSTRYGLAAGIVTKDLNVANTVSRSIRAGTIWINCYFAFDNDCPVGGYKMSGFGRDFGLEALHKYFQVKSVVTPIYNSPWLWIWYPFFGVANACNDVL